MSISPLPGEFQPDRRWALRRAIQIDADLADSDGLSYAARVTDISEEGCMVRLSRECELVRDRLHTIKITGVEALPAYVIWCADGKAGLAFSEPLRPGTVQNLVMKSHYARISRHFAEKNAANGTLTPLPPFPFED